MSLFLRVRSDGRTKDVAILQPGQPLTIGRLTENDVSMPDDDQMSSRHASLLQDADTCTLQDLNSTNGTTVNGEPVTSAELQHGDSFCCGATEFVIDWASQKKSESAQGESQTAVADPDVSGSVVTASDDTAPDPAVEDPCQQEVDIVEGWFRETASEVFEHFQLAQKLTLAPEADEAIPAFAERLLNHADGTEALNFLAFALPRRSAVWWAIECARTAGPSGPMDAQILELTEGWVQEPTDEPRRAAFAIVEEHQAETPAAFAATAAFHAHGSTTPPEGPYVGSPYDLAGTMVFVAANLASARGAHDEFAERRREFVNLADRIASGEHVWANVTA